MTQAAKPAAYTNAIALQLGFIPAGYFPVGDTTSLSKLVQDHVKSGASQVEAKFYQLTAEPGFVRPQIDDAAILAKIQRLATGQENLTISTESLRAKAAPFTATLGGLLKTARATFEGASTDKLNLGKVASLLGMGQLTIDSLRASGDALVKKVEDSFWEAKTDTFIRNAHGVFVSRQWLEDPANATFVSNVRI